MTDGVFQTDREIFENPIWKRIIDFRLFFYIYGNAVYSPKGMNYGNVHVGRGQFLKSYRKLSEELEYIENNAVKRYSGSSLKRAVTRLERDGRVTTLETEHGTLFTVINYEEYQGFERFKKQGLERGLERGLEQQRNSSGTAAEQQRNNNKKDNKDNKEKKNIYSDLISEYTNNQKLAEAINDFMKMRNKIKAPMTERAVKLLFTELNKLTSDDEIKVLILEQSILKNWKGVFQLRDMPQEDKSYLEQARRELENDRQRGR